MKAPVHFTLAIAFVGASGAACAQTCSYAPYVSDANTVALVNFNGSIGSALSQTGSITYVPGPNGAQQAASFAADAWAEYAVPLWSSTNIPAAGTVEEWVQISGYDSNSLVLNWYNTVTPPEAGYVLEVGTNASGNFTVGGWNGGPFNPPAGTSNLPLNTWTQLAYTWGPNGTQLFVNGVAQASSTTSYGPWLNPTTYLYVNSWGGATLSIAGFRISSVVRASFCASAPASIAATGGTPQSTPVNAAFNNPLSATVTDVNGNPVSGVSVTFTAPASGASGAFAGGGATDTEPTNASGVATTLTFFANSVTGTYSVSATVPGVSTPASFSLTNTPGAPSSVTAASGGGQSALVNSAFSNPLAATVKDANGNPVSGVNVTFSAPASGASGTFAGGSATETVATNTLGVASTSIFSANATTGTYSVTAAVTGLALLASFSLTNVPVLTITTTSVPDGTKGLVYSYTLIAQNGTPPYTWSIASGTLPAGLNLDSASGAITGTPSVAAVSSFTVKVTDKSAPAQQATQSFSNVAIINGLTITTVAVPRGTAGLAYSTTLTGQSGTTPYTWSISSGTLPAGLSLNPSTGVITGMPTAAGTFVFTVHLSDSSAPTHQGATQALSLFINPPPTEPLIPTFTFTGIPPSQPPGTDISNAKVALTQPSSAAYTGTLTMALVPGEAGLPVGYLADAGFVDSGGNKSATTTILVPEATTSVPFPTLDPGTVAGDLTVTLTVGGESVAASTVAIEPLAPIIEANSVQIIDITSTGFSVELVATSTPRDLATATFTFTAGAGAQISGSSTFAVNVSSLSTPWFASSSSLNYGGAFSLTIPFTISGPASAIQSVSVTLTNSVGTSAAVTGTQ